MDAIEIVDVLDAGNDRLIVKARAQVELEADGWVSATTNHYPPEAYDEHGQLVEGAESHPMSRDELHAYAERLIREQNPGVKLAGAPAASAEPVSLL